MDYQELHWPVPVTIDGQYLFTINLDALERNGDTNMNKSRSNNNTTTEILGYEERDSRYPYPLRSRQKYREKCTFSTISRGSLVNT